MQGLGMDLTRSKRCHVAHVIDNLPQLRFNIVEAARILRLSRAALYDRVRDGLIKVQKDGRRTYITADELHRYVAVKA